jgi:hypothetical protein
MGWYHARTVLMAIATVSALGICSCSGDHDSGSKTGNTIQITEPEFYGWDSTALVNRFIRMDVVPDLGGKIMGYDFLGNQILWHTPTQEGHVDTDQGYGFGDGFFNPGGAKVWPSPQGWDGDGQWPGPPDNVLDGSVYDLSFDGSHITVTSPPDDAPGRSGLQLTHTYSLVPTTTIADLHLSMTNVVDRPVRWGLWHIATVPVDRPYTVYAPVADDNDWHVMFGAEDNPQWHGVEDGMFTASYDRRVGKVGLRTTEGWVAWHDEENGLTFVMQFPMDADAEYPDGGSTVEIWTTGTGSIQARGKEISYEYDPNTAHMELEVMGPLTDLKPRETASLDVTWSVCKSTGVTDVIPAGVIAQPLRIEDGTILGSFGTFHIGELHVACDAADGSLLYDRILGKVSPQQPIEFNMKVESTVARTAHVRIFITDLKRSTVLGEFDEVSLP